MSQSKYKRMKIINLLHFDSIIFSLSYMWVNSIAWTAIIIVFGRINYKLDSDPTWLYIHLHTMGDNRDMFVGLGWEKKIRSLRDPHIPFNPSPEFEFVAGNRGNDDYELTLFL